MNAPVYKNLSALFTDVDEVICGVVKVLCHAEIVDRTEYGRDQTAGYCDRLAKVFQDLSNGVLDMAHAKTPPEDLAKDRVRIYQRAIAVGKIGAKANTDKIIAAPNVTARDATGTQTPASVTAGGSAVITITRGEFNAMTPAAQANHFRNGGKVID